MKRTDLEKLKAKQLDNRLARERAAHRPAAGAGHDSRSTLPATGLVGRLLRKALAPED